MREDSALSEKNKELAQAFLTALSSGDGDAMDAILTDDCVVDAVGSSIVSKVRDRGEVVRSCGYFKRTTKDGIRFEILNMTAEDDRVSVEAVGFAEFPDGTTYNNQYHFLFFLRGGKVCRLREYFDTKLADDVFRPILTRAR